MKEKEKKSFLAISIEAGLKTKYSEFCEKHGYSVSKRIKLFVEKEIDNKVKFDD